MPDQPRRITLEKSRTVRRRYQRSNKRFQFTASQIERIEREEERESRAKKLREKEKKRLANKKKRAEKEAKEREERRRHGLPDPHVLAIPASQPLLSRFLKKPESVADKPETGSEDCEDTESASEGSIATEIDEDLLSCLDEATFDNQMISAASEMGAGKGSTEISDPQDVVGQAPKRDDDEFSECSIFYDEEIMKETETIARILETPRNQEDTDRLMKPPYKPVLPMGESFQDDTAVLLEEFGHELDTDEEFEQELIRLDSVEAIA